MFESLFGAETPLAVRFFIAFVVVFALIGAAAWLLRRFGATRLGGQAARGRQPRLAVIEAGAVDGRRKLVLVRRDNVEHLLMIGGPSDIVIEQNIIRGQTSRESAPARAEPGWPAPEPTARTRTVVADELAWQAESDTHIPMPAQVTSAPPPPRRPVRAQAPAADPLAGLAAELSTRDGDAPRLTPSPGEGARRTAPSLDAVRPGDVPAPRRAEPAGSRAPEPTPMMDSLREKSPAPAQDPLVAMMAGGPPAAAPRAPADTNLAEMAHRLEAALRRQPGSPDKRAAAKSGGASAPAMPSGAAHSDHPPAQDRARPDGEKAAEPAPATAPEQSPFSSLEEEMANLLGRPPGKG
jgi:flagellar biogenesis protein FliO